MNCQGAKDEQSGAGVEAVTQRRVCDMKTEKMLNLAKML